ncbi:PilW family protein [Cellvibrio sp. QJXJ]|uniref:PilW family protein n=1 Tax=Cellvibrio sp. QJXJ TaxID=2964606 RepID=UPI0021C318E6|nr:PilW family protein [Cellvibrio sp. QJXJ]UUA71036.1 PilW family protein [Cellvibrio sp. QJXJ]
MKKQKGLSLIELMIAITLGLILITGVLQVFISSKTVYTTQQALSRIQETGRLAIDFLARDIRMAGYMGCATRSSEMKVSNMLNNSSSYKYDFNTAIMGYTAGTLPVGHGLVPAPKVNTDLFVLRGAYGSGVSVTKNNMSGTLFANNTGIEDGACSDGGDRVSGICEGDILVVTDCTKARVFQVVNLQTVQGSTEMNVVHSGNNSYSPGNANASWGGNSGSDDEKFKPGSEILSATNVTYFIADGTSGRPSLWQNINGVNLELLEGVEDMSVRYGVDSNEDYVPDNYRLAGEIINVADWEKVVALRVELLVASIDDGVLPEMQKYSFEGVDNIEPDPADRRLRQVFSTTIGIRSRSF